MLVNCGMCVLLCVILSTTALQHAIADQTHMESVVCSKIASLTESLVFKSILFQPHWAFVV